MPGAADRARRIMPRVRPLASRTLAIALAASLLAASGCFQTEKPRAADPSAGSIQALGPDGKPRLTQAELSALVRAFADRYTEICNQALDDLKRLVHTPRARAVAQGRKAYGAASMYAIAARPNPEVALLDLAVQVTVEREIYTRGAATEVFAEHASILEEAYDRLDADVWALAARVFTEAQLDELRDAIEQWLVDNPNQRYLGFVQVDNFARFRQNSSLGDVGSPGGLSMLAPINEATRAADEIRLLGERALYVAQRMPLLVEAQAELLVYNSLGQPEVAQASERLELLSDSLSLLASKIDSLPETIAEERGKALQGAAEILAKEREAIVGQLNVATGDARAAIADLRETVGGAGPLASDAKEAAAALRDALATVDRLAMTLDPDGAGPERMSLPNAEHALQELGAVLRETRTLLESESWGKRVGDIDDAAGRRVNHAGLVGAGLLILCFSLALAYRVAASRLVPREPPRAA